MNEKVLVVSSLLAGVALGGASVGLMVAGRDAVDSKKLQLEAYKDGVLIGCNSAPPLVDPAPRAVYCKGLAKK